MTRLLHRRGSRHPFAVRHQLTVLGGQEPPTPREAFVTALELRLSELMSSSASGDLMPEIEMAPPPPKTSVGRFRLATAAVACVLIVACVGVASSIDGRTGPTLAIPASSPATAGIEAGEPGTAAPSDSTAPAPASGVTGAPIVVYGTPPAETPAATVVPREPVVLEGTAKGTPARVFLSWQRYEGADFGAYLVLRSTVDEVDHHDTTGRTHLLLRIENRDMVTHQDTPQLGTTPRYRIVAVDSAGNVVAGTSVMTPWQAFDQSSREMTPLNW